MTNASPADREQRARECLLQVVGKNRLTAFGEANAIRSMLAFTAAEIAARMCDSNTVPPGSASRSSSASSSACTAARTSAVSGTISIEKSRSSAVGARTVTSAVTGRSASM